MSVQYVYESEVSPAIRALGLWNGTSNDAPPAEWYAVDFDDAAWGEAVENVDEGYSTFALKAWYENPSTGGTTQCLLRHTFTLPEMEISSARIRFEVNNAMNASYVNEEAIWTTAGTVSGSTASGWITVDPAILNPGETNVIAVHGRDRAPSWAFVAWQLEVTGELTASGSGGVTRGRRVPEFTVNFYRRDFTGGLIAPRCTFRPTLLTWTALGGCDTATVVATGTEGALWDLADMLRCPVVILDQDGQYVWWGYVAAANIDYGLLSFGVNLDSMANRVAVAYANQASGVTTSSRATTDWAEDAESIGEYGTFERLESLSDAGDTEAVSRRDALLAALRLPTPEIDFTSGGLSGSLTCRGWWHALKRRYYLNDGTLDVETTEQIQDIIADVGAEFFTGCEVATDSGLDTNEHRDGDSNAWQIVEDLLESGVAGEGARLLANVTVNRVLEVSQEPAPGVTDGRLYPSGDMTDGFGAPVRIGPGLVGRWVRLTDALPPYLSLSRVADPTLVYIERAEYDVEKVRMRPQPRGLSAYRVSRVEAG